jgi:hypothetical protein
MPGFDDCAEHGKNLTRIAVNRGYTNEERSIRELLHDGATLGMTLGYP